MSRTLISIRIFFLLLCITGSWLVCLTIPEWSQHQGRALFIGTSIGALVILIDIFLKGFSLRGLTALSFGLAVGGFISWMISVSPLFELAAEENVFLTRLALFAVGTYLGAVIALRGKDEFHLVIPYVRFVPHGVTMPLVVIDTSALIDGRIVEICRCRFLNYGLVVPTFVLDELQAIADSPERSRREKGRKGIAVLSELQAIPELDLRIQESEIDDARKVDAKLIFLAQQLKAHLLTTDYNLARLAELQGVQWLNLTALAQALHPSAGVGDEFEIELVKPGRDPGQAVGYLGDGSMVVVKQARDSVGKQVRVRIESIIPSAGGKMLFAHLIPNIAQTEPESAVVLQR